MNVKCIIATTVTAICLLHALPAVAQTDVIVNRSNWLTAEVNQQSYRRTNEVTTSAVISRQGTAPVPLEFALLDLDGFQYEGVVEGKASAMRLAKHLELTYTDSFLVMHDGKVVYEKYFNGMQPYQRHIMMSVTKSFVGTILATLVSEGKLRAEDTVDEYIPELRATPFAEVTVRQVLDMTSGIAYSEIYTDPNSDVWRYTYSIGLGEPPKDFSGPKNVEDYIVAMKRDEPPGVNFNYVTPLSEVACWLIRKQTGKPFATVLSDRIWSKIGAEHDALILTESTNKALAGSGLYATARDLARVGKMLAQKGEYSGNQVVPADVVVGFMQGGDRKAFLNYSKANPSYDGFSYRDQWWVTHNEHKAFLALGVFGQVLYVDPTANMVIVKQSSTPVALLDFAEQNDCRMFHALAKHLQVK